VSRWLVSCRGRSALGLAALFLVGIGSGFGVTDPSRPTELLKSLEVYERQLLDRPGSSVQARFGLDPFRIQRLADGQHLVLMRNGSELRLLDSDYETVDRIPTPEGPSGWSQTGPFTFVCGETSGEIRLYETTNSSLREVARVRFPNIDSLREIEYVPELRTLYGLDGLDQQLVAFPIPTGIAEATSRSLATIVPIFYPVCRGPLDVRYSNGVLFVIGYLDHEFWAIPSRQGRLDFANKTVVEHDGPIWSMDIRPIERGHCVVLGGVENHPLDRTGGEFGWVDSFAYYYELSGVAKSNESPFAEIGPTSVDPSGLSTGSTEFAIRQVGSVNLSTLGIVTPKRIRFESGSGDIPQVWILGHGSEFGGRFALSASGFHLLERVLIPPGVADFVSGPPFLAVSTILDNLCEVARKKEEWTESDPRTGSPAGSTAEPPTGSLAKSRNEAMTVSRAVQPIARTDFGVPIRDSELVLGEALAWTTLLTPNNQTSGALSRFTCETCHFEGGVDGRIHFTGRDQIFAATKPIRGLADNVPVFSRAGDRTLSTMILAEFLVANQSRNQWFEIETSGSPWMVNLGLPDKVRPDAQRLALLRFFAELEHHPKSNREKIRDSDIQPGLELFRDRCAGCHLPIRSTRQPEALVPFETWASILLDPRDDLIWGSDRRMRTGIVPYVSPAGARVPSLRRVSRKYPYFTNGSSDHLQGVLERFRFQGFRSWHDSPSGEESPTNHSHLSREEIRALLDVLKLM